MRTTLAVRNAEWDEATVAYDRIPSRLNAVFCRYSGRPTYDPWVIAGPSAILQRVNARGNGLFAARPFKQGDIIGRYSGAVVNAAPYATREEAMASEEVQALVRRGVDTLMAVRADTHGWNVLDATDGPIPYLHLVNDPRGSRLQPNVELSDWGYMRVTASRIPAFLFNQDLASNIHSELRFRYSDTDSFWDVHDNLGTADMPLEV